MSEPLRIGFLGAGKMATALAQGWIQAGLTVAGQVCASDPAAAARKHFTKTTGAATLADNSRVAAQSSIVVLAVKPQNMPEVLTALKPEITAQHVLISIAAGITLKQLAERLGPERRLIRVVPNTPCLVGASASAYAAAETATNDDVALVERFVTGKEVQVGILNGRVLGAIEVAPKKGIYDYEAKYTPGMTDYYMPARLPATRYGGVLNLAERAARVLGCSGGVPACIACSTRRPAIMLCERIKNAPKAIDSASRSIVISGPTQRATSTIEATSRTGSERMRKRIRKGIRRLASVGFAGGLPNMVAEAPIMDGKIRRARQ